MNDTEREQWVSNDEGLYSWWRSTGLGMSVFVRTYRSSLDAAIDCLLHPKRNQRKWWEVT